MDRGRDKLRQTEVRPEEEAEVRRWVKTEASKERKVSGTSTNLRYTGTH